MQSQQTSATQSQAQEPTQTAPALTPSQPSQQPRGRGRPPKTSTVPNIHVQTPLQSQPVSSNITLSLFYWNDTGDDLVLMGDRQLRQVRRLIDIALVIALNYEVAVPPAPMPHSARHQAHTTTTTEQTRKYNPHALLTLIKYVTNRVSFFVSELSSFATQMVFEEPDGKRISTPNSEPPTQTVQKNNMCRFWFNALSRVLCLLPNDPRTYIHTAEAALLVPDWGVGPMLESIKKEFTYDIVTHPREITNGAETHKRIQAFISVLGTLGDHLVLLENYQVRLMCLQALNHICWQSRVYYTTKWPTQSKAQSYPILSELLRYKSGLLLHIVFSPQVIATIDNFKREQSPSVVLDTAAITKMEWDLATNLLCATFDPVLIDYFSCALILSQRHTRQQQQHQQQDEAGGGTNAEATTMTSDRSATESFINALWEYACKQMKMVVIMHDRQPTTTPRPLSMLFYECAACVGGETSIKDYTTLLNDEKIEMNKLFATNLLVFALSQLIRLQAKERNPTLSADGAAGADTSGPSPAAADENKKLVTSFINALKFSGGRIVQQASAASMDSYNYTGLDATKLISFLNSLAPTPNDASTRAVNEIHIQHLECCLSVLCVLIPTLDMRPFQTAQTCDAIARAVQQMVQRYLSPTLTAAPMEVSRLLQGTTAYPSISRFLVWLPEN